MLQLKAKFSSNLLIKQASITPKPKNNRLSMQWKVLDGKLVAIWRS